MDGHRAVCGAHSPRGASITTRPSIPPCAPPPAWNLGSVVLAEEQTAGQGRHGHAWHSEPGARHLLLDGAPALARCSRWRWAWLPPTPSRKPPASPAICAGPTTSCSADRKIAGILVQLVDGKAIAGIGINVNHTVVSRRNWRRSHLAAPRQTGPDRIPRETILLALLPRRRRLRRTATRTAILRLVHARLQLRRRPARGGAAARWRHRRHHRRPGPGRLPDRAPGRRNRYPDSCGRRTCCWLLTQATATSPSALSKAASCSASGGCAPSTSRPPTSGASCCTTCSRRRASTSTRVDGIIISSVVPPIDSTLAAMARALFPHRSHVRRPAHRSRHRPSATTTPTKWAPTAWSTASPASTSTAARA